jgi:hypothetical protein
MSRQTVFLVEPDYPVPRKSKNHFKWLPLPLLKMATYFRRQGSAVYLIRGCHLVCGARPDRVLVTSLFTYWSEYVARTVAFYKNLYPDAPLTVGGVYATLLSCGRDNAEKDCSTCAEPCHPRRIGADEVWIGDWPEVDRCPPAYDLVPSVDYVVTQVSKGCPYNCPFCANHRLSRWQWRDRMGEDLWANKAVFYDPAFLSNPAIEGVLEELAAARPGGRVVRCDAQSGFDKRLLVERPELARALKRAHFIAPRIAWDEGLAGKPVVEEAIRVLQSAKYRRKDVQVFMLYNWALPFDVLEEKRRQCLDWGVQVADCRFRPLDALYDHYDPWAIHQGPEAYYIHPNWTDEQIRRFRRACREQNILVRFGRSYEDYRAWRRSGGKPGRGGHSRRVYPADEPVQMALF